MAQKFQKDPLADISNNITSIIQEIVDKKKIKRKPEKPIKDQETLREQLREYVNDECNLGILEPYSRELKQYKEILKQFTDRPPNALSFSIVTRMIGMMNQLNYFMTQIRSSATLLKEDELKKYVIEKAKKILGNYKQVIVQLYEQQSKILEYYEDFCMNPPAVYLGPNGIKFYGVPKYLNLTTAIQKWWKISLLKEDAFEVAKKKKDIPSEPIFLDFLSETKEKIKKKKRKERFISLKSMMKQKSYTDLKRTFINFLKTGRIPEKIEELRDEDLDGPIFYYLRSLKYIEKTDNDFKDSLTRKTIKKNLKSNIKDQYLGNLMKLSKGLIKSKKALSGKLDKIIPRISLGLERDLESKILAMDEKSDEEKEIAFKEEITRIYTFLDIQRNWLLGLEEYLGDYSDILDKHLRIISEVESELERKADDFIRYLDSIIEQSVRSELDQEINAKIEKLESLLKDYEETTATIIHKESPESKKLEEILENFEEQFYSINKEVEKIFKKYKDEDFNVYNSLIRWEEKFSEIKNKVRFVVSSLFSSFFSKYRDVMEREKGFFARFSKMTTSDASSVPLSFSLDMLMPEKLTEKQIRERISNIDLKVKELESTIDEYKKERKKYEQFLKGYLDEKGHIESTQCVICHKKIDLVNEKYIECEFCNRLMHYLCGAWWLEKHNSCPVCNNEYVVPNSGLFETDYYNPEEDEGLVDFNEDEEEDFIEIDMEKYPPEGDTQDRNERAENDVKKPDDDPVERNKPKNEEE